MNPEKASFLSHPESNEELIEITTKPQKQYFMSMVIRGPINAAQVIKKDNKYYSHKQNMDNLSENENALAKAEAEIFILNFGFNDADHIFVADPDEKQSSVYHSNITLNKENTKYSIYDFERAFELHENTSLNNLLSPENKDKFKEKIAKELWVISKTNSIEARHPDRLAIEKNDFNFELLTSLKNKLESFLSITFKDDSIFKLALEKSGFNLFDSDLNIYFSKFNNINLSTQEKRGQIMYEDIHTRLGIILEVVKEYLNKDFQS